VWFKRKFELKLRRLRSQTRSIKLVHHVPIHKPKRVENIRKRKGIISHCNENVGECFMAIGQVSEIT
jgi:hypothetical protein